MMDKIKSLFKSDEELIRMQKDFDALREAEEKRREYKMAENERYRQMMNSAHVMQNAIASSPYQQQERYAQGWNDPRASGLRGAVPISHDALVNSLADTNQLIKQVVARMEKQERRIEMLSGFYTWIMDVHPEIAAQHKAMRDLYEAANAPQQEQVGRQP